MAQRCGVMVWKEDVGGQSPKTSCFVTFQLIHGREAWYIYFIPLLILCSQFAKLAQAVVCCCLVSRAGSLWHSGALTSGKSIRAAAGSLCSIKARVLSSPSLCLSSTVICFNYREEERVKLWVVSQVAVGSGSVLLCSGKCWWYTVGARTDKQ